MLFHNSFNVNIASSDTPFSEYTSLSVSHAARLIPQTVCRYQYLRRGRLVRDTLWRPPPKQFLYLLSQRRLVDLGFLSQYYQLQNMHQHCLELPQPLYAARLNIFPICFAKVNNSWVFLVLIAPLAVTYDYEVSMEDEFNFCYRDPKELKQAPYAWHASDAPITDIIDYVARGLQEKGPQFVAHILIDIYWGWERYLAQVKNDIRGIMVKSRLWHEVLDLAICWRFFKYKLVLKDTKAKYTREMTYLSLSGTQQFSDWKLPVRLDNVLKRLDHIQIELESLESPLDEITRMALAYSFTSIKEAQFSSHSSHNMEYLAVMATIFLPLTLLSGLFGMNVYELISTGPHWWLFPAVALPSTGAFFCIFYGGRKYWSLSRRNLWRNKMRPIPKSKREEV